MSSRRLLKAAEAIREVVSMAILTEMRDPRVQDVTVIGVEVAPDMRSAKVLVSIMGPESKQQLALRGLDNAKGFLQARIAERIDTRYTPKLQFVADQGVKKSLEVGKILEQLAAERQAAEQGLPASDDDSELETQQAAGAIKQFAPDTDEEADDDADLDDESDFDDDDEFDDDELDDEVFEDDDLEDDDSDLDDDVEDDDVDETEVDDEYSDDESDK